MHAYPARRRPSLATVVSFLALFVALSDSGAAATVRNFVLGKTNGSTRTTGIAAPTRGPVLAMTNTGAGTAGSFTVRAGAQPFTVNSPTLVKNLNADRLDGVSSNAFWNTGGNAGTSPKTDYLGTSDNQPLSIRTDGNEAVRVDSNGAVGIGTSTPSSLLTVVGSNQPGATADVVNASTNAGKALHGQANTGTGVAGTTDSGIGVSADASSGTGVEGKSANGVGVLGASTNVGVAGSADVLPSGIPECPGGLFLNGAVGVAGCGGSLGVFGEGDSWGVLGSLQGPSSSSCAAHPAAVVGCGADRGDGVVGALSNSADPNSAAIHASAVSGGSLFVGDVVGHTKVRIDNTGKGFFDGGTAVGGADYADSMRADASGLRPGDVLAIDPAKDDAVGLSHSANSPLVAGVYSTKPSVIGVGNHHIGDSLAGDVPVALVGIVPTRVSAENGPVQVGDLLTTSDTPGYAMKAKPVVVNGVAVYPSGTILGKAMAPLHAGKGLIKVLVTLR